MCAELLQSCSILCNPMDYNRLLCPWDSPGKSTGVVPGRGALSRALSNTQKWIVQGDTCADNARDFIDKVHLGREQWGKGNQENWSATCLTASGCFGNGISFWVVFSHSFWRRVLPGGTRLVQPRWMPARRILGGGRTCGVSFWPFLTSSGWCWLISSMFLTRISCPKTTHANGHYGAWPGWAVSVSVLLLTEWVAMPSSRGSSWPRAWILVSYASCLGRQVLQLKKKKKENK